MIEDLTLTKATNNFLPNFTFMADNPTLYCCHHVWIGPGKISPEGLFKLHDKYKLYQAIEGQFIPTLCLNQDAVCNLQYNNVPLKLIKLTDPKLPIDDLIINQATKLEHCEHILKIDLCNNGKDLAYIPVFILEDLYGSMKLRLNTLSTLAINDYSITTDKATSTRCVLKEEAQTAYTEKKNYFQEPDAMFNYLKDKVIAYLYDKQQYAAASDLVRLLLLILKPGCYIDLVDMEMKRLPLRSDFSEIDLLTYRGENYLIFCVNPATIVDVLTCMYIKIRAHQENTSIETMVQYDPHAFVTYLAGFETWNSLLNLHNICNLRFNGKQEYAAALIKEICGDHPGLSNSMIHFSYNNPYIPIKRRIAFISKKLLPNDLFQHIIMKEIKELPDDLNKVLTKIPANFHENIRLGLMKAQELEPIKEQITALQELQAKKAVSRLYCLLS